jgi:hypothetical protein
MFMFHFIIIIFPEQSSMNDESLQSTTNTMSCSMNPNVLCPMSLDHTQIHLPTLYCILKVKTHRMSTIYSCKLQIMCIISEG